MPSPGKEERLAAERKWAFPAAAAAFGSIGFTVAAGLYVSSSIGATPEADNTRELLRIVDEQGSVFIAGAVISGIGTLLLGAVLVYLFNSAKARQQDLQPAALVLAILGAVLLAVAAVAIQINLVDRASEFLASGAQTEDRADELVANRPVILQSFGIGGAMAFAFATIMISQAAMRAGLLTRFLGILGYVVGALFVLGMVFPLGTDVIRLFWLVSVGLVILGWWPGGRGPAWASGESEPWLTPAQLRALERAEHGDGAENGGGAASGNGASGGVNGSSGGAGADAQARTRPSRKRKKRR